MIILIRLPDHCNMVSIDDITNKNMSRLIRKIRRQLFIAHQHDRYIFV